MAPFSVLNKSGGVSQIAYSCIILHHSVVWYTENSSMHLFNGTLHISCTQPSLLRAVGAGLPGADAGGSRWPTTLMDILNLAASHSMRLIAINRETAYISSYENPLAFHYIIQYIIIWICLYHLEHS